MDLRRSHWIIMGSARFPDRNTAAMWTELDTQDGLKDITQWLRIIDRNLGNTFKSLDALLIAVNFGRHRGRTRYCIILFTAYHMKGATQGLSLPSPDWSPHLFPYTLTGRWMICLLSGRRRTESGPSDDHLLNTWLPNRRRVVWAVGMSVPDNCPCNQPKNDQNLSIALMYGQR